MRTEFDVGIPRAEVLPHEKRLRETVFLVEPTRFDESAESIFVWRDVLSRHLFVQLEREVEGSET